MVKRIAQRVGDGLSPGKKLFIGSGIAGAIAFVHTVCPHRTPFIVVAFQPDLEQVSKSSILRDIFRQEMAVIVKNRLIGGICAKELFCFAIMQQKIFCDEWHAGSITPGNYKSGFRDSCVKSSYARV